MELKQYLQELKKVVNIDCGTATIDGVAQVSQIFQQWYEAEGWQCDSIPLGDKVGPGLFATNKPDATQYDVLLVGHMDTVFPEGTVAERPFSIEGNRAFGPGVSDMKSGLLNILWALRGMDKATLQRLSIGVAMNPDEETGSVHSHHWIGELAKRSRCVLVCEAARADGSLVKARKGIAGYKLTFKGVAAHAGNDPESGRSAIKALARAVLEISDLADITKGTTINTGVISGGVVPNIVPDHAEMIVDVRFQDNDEYARVHAAIEAFGKREFEREVKTLVQLQSQKPAMTPSAETEQLMQLVEQAGAAEGIDVRWKSVGGGSDANHTAALGIPSLDGFGPIGAGFHSASEYLELDSIEPRIRLLKRVIQSL
ncbi:M20 family metallopeptidase [Buttiauxella selenatireducens]|uniref:M20 family metallopeptidase n=1 Tax=Buttiauxella selenatireducens TaxID=3073902 RepID=A0ABY9SCI2_9ENTR|nr:M20 family metallopeptidase [Buttiauxella sp. R73]WMY75220.1 M20 family metallopeptidase [Buttiauxella sp. R73]